LYSAEVHYCNDLASFFVDYGEKSGNPNAVVKATKSASKLHTAQAGGTCKRMIRLHRSIAPP
jgi:hypothetical protein